MSKTSVYRILKTLVHRGYVAHGESGEYRLVSRPKRLRFGLAVQSAELPFSQQVAASVTAAAASSGVELLILDNHFDAETAIRNAEEFVNQRVDLVLEFQAEEHVAPHVAYLFKNADPRGSLAANVGNSTVRCLSNMKLGDMLENRHPMSLAVRTEVSPQSQAWGYSLGSVYIRKVHFRDVGMIKQIEEKVVNRLRQVTSAIKQDGVNQVSIITSSAEREAAVEIAKAAVVRPNMIGTALKEISGDPEVADALFEILETQRILSNSPKLTLFMEGAKGRLLADLLAAQDAPPAISSK